MKSSVEAVRKTTMLAAVVLGATLSSLGSARASVAERCPPGTIDKISRYCNSCWRNARLHPDSWIDCTQEVFVRLIERVDPNSWSELLEQSDREERKEFLRAIDAVKKRTKRAKVHGDLSFDPIEKRPDYQSDSRQQLEELMDHVAPKELSERQRTILDLSRDGWSVEEVARELNISAARVSDEKYKAIRKLRKYIGNDPV